MNRRTSLPHAAGAVLVVALGISLVGASSQAAFASGRCSTSTGTVEQRTAAFWQCVNSLGPADQLTAEDLGQWGQNVIDRNPGAGIRVVDFRASTAGMQVAVDGASSGIPSAPPKSSDVESRIALFWQRVDALGPDALLTATDLGQWALNLIDRDPSRRIRVDDFRANTAVMQAAFDRAAQSARPPVALPRLVNAFTGRTEQLLLGANVPEYVDYFGLGYDMDRAMADAHDIGVTIMRVNLSKRTGIRGGDLSPVSWGGFGAKPRNATYAGLEADQEWRFQQVDRLLDIGARRGVRVLLNLADIFREDTDDRATRIAKNPGIDSSPSGRQAFKAWIAQFVQRRNTVNGRVWRDDPTIFGWDLLNEPEPRYNAERIEAVVFSSCSELAEWVADIAAYVKTIDPRHFVTLGTADDVCVKSLAISALDFVSFHWYRRSYPSNLGVRMGDYVAKFASLGKPVIIEEFGASTSRRPDVLDDSYVSYFRSSWDEATCAGVSGLMFWSWGPVEARRELRNPDVTRYFDPPYPPWPVPGGFWASLDHNMDDAKFVDFLRRYRPPTSC